MVGITSWVNIRWEWWWEWWAITWIKDL